MCSMLELQSDLVTLQKAYIMLHICETYDMLRNLARWLTLASWLMLARLGVRVKVRFRLKG
jgi:1-acyl-sn-glycerol-3-phosphate acyltransferase